MVDYLIKIGLYAALGLLLLVANVWYFKSLFNSFFTTLPPKSLAPFVVVGKEDPNGKLGEMLARQLQEKLREIAHTMAVTKQKLETQPEKTPQHPDHDIVQQEGEVQILPQAHFTFAQSFLSVTESALLLDLFNHFDLKVSVGGVDVGGLVAWLQSKFSSERVLLIGVEYQDNMVSIVGDGFSSSVILGTDTKSIIERIAYAMLQQEVNKEFPGAVSLSHDDFRRYMTSLEDFADLYNEDLRRQRKGGPWIPSQYRTLLSDVTALQKKAPDWKPLLRLSATLAEMTGDARQAHVLYTRELELTDAGDEGHSWIRAKLAALEKTIEPVSEIELARPATGISLHEDKNIIKTLRENEAARRLFALIGGDVAVAQKETRVAVLGGLPWGQDGAASEQPEYLADYVETLAQVVKMVTPSAHLLFEPLATDNAAALGNITDRELVPSLEKLIAAKPDVLLIAIGPLQSPVYIPLLEHAVAQGILVLFSAGSQTDQSRQQFVQPQLVENTMIVSAVTLAGLPASYAPTDPNLYWAPGEQIPVYNPERQVLEQRAGTGYAAAVAAGIAARVIVENPDLSLVDVLGILRMSAVQQEPGTGVSVLNLQNALAKAQSLDVAAGELFEESDHVDMMIPDGEPTGIRRTIRVDKQGHLLDVRIHIDITHTYIGDLKVWLTSPLGQSFILHDRQGGSKDNLIKEYGLAVAPGFSELIGTDISGEWTLSVADMSKMDVGRLKSWALKLRYEAKD